jgi:hypothetical protein
MLTDMASTDGAELRNNRRKKYLELGSTGLAA